MKMLLFLLVIISCPALYAQQPEPGKEKPHYQLPNWDSIHNALLGTDYVPFSITTLDGKRLDNHSIKGKVTFFTFWFKNCAPCLAEFDELNELYGHFRNDTNVVFVAITFDKKEYTTDVLEKYNVTFPVATITSQNEAHRMNYSRGFPSLVVLDKDGKVRRSGVTAIVSNDRKTSNTILTIDSAMRLINRYKSN